MQWIANPPMFFKGIRWFESNHFRLGELSERFMVQTWKVCVGKTTRGSNPLFSVWQCSSVVEQEIHTLYVGSSILPTAL
jgi:hypothetical protein